MTSSAEFWENGRRLWSVWHQGDQSVSNLETDGNLPDEFSEIERHYRAEQTQDSSNTVDYIFEIPLGLAKGITGFKHDEADDDEFEELEVNGSSKPASKPWWRFGR